MRPKANSLVALLCLLALAILTPEVFGRAAYQDFKPSPYVYRVRASGCSHEPRERSLTGFRVEGTDGIVTALHGVVDCVEKGSIKAAHEDDPYLEDLVILRVDIDNDVALLWSHEIGSLPRRALQVSTARIWKDQDPLRIIGYPLGKRHQWPTDVTYVESSLLEKAIEGVDAMSALRDRNSPSLKVEVISLQGHLQPGHSGAPVVDTDGRLVGIGNGGLQKGSGEIGWAMPWSKIEWEDPKSRGISDKYEKLKIAKPEDALSFSTTFPGAPSGRPAVLRGRVVDVNGDPVRDADITLAFRDRYSIATSGTNGSFATQVGAGELPETILIEAEGYETYESDLNGEWPPTNRPFRLLPLCNLELFVDNGDREPVALAAVYMSTGPLKRNGQTDDNGYFIWSYPCSQGTSTLRIRVVAEGYLTHNRYYSLTTSEPIEIILQHTRPPTDTPKPAPTRASAPTRTPTPTPTPRPPSMFERMPGLQGQPIVFRGMLGPQELIWALEFDPTGQWLVSGTDETDYFFLWDVNSQRLLTLFGGSYENPNRGHSARVRAVAFTPDGKWLASSGDDGSLRIWDVGHLPNPIIDDPELSSLNGYRSLAFYPDGSWLAAGGQTLQLYRFSQTSSHLSAEASYSGPNTYYSVAFDRYGRTMAAATSDHTVEVIDFAKPARTTLFGHEDIVLSVVYSPTEANLLMSGSWDGTVRVWDLNQRGREVKRFLQSPKQIWSIDVSPDGKTIAAGGNDGTVGKVYLWDLENLNAQPIVLDHFSPWGGAVAFSPDGRYFAYSAVDLEGLQYIRVYQLK